MRNFHPIATDGFALPFLQATRVEIEQIRLSLIELRRINGVNMTGVDNWRLYYPAAEVARSYTADGDFSGSAKVLGISCHSNARSLMMSKHPPNP